MMLHTIPGDYAIALFLGDVETRIAATPEDVEKVRKQLCLDGSLPTQYTRWVVGFVQGDFGDSWTTRLPFLERMLPRIRHSPEKG